jgi:hypothetical protein
VTDRPMSGVEQEASIDRPTGLLQWVLRKRRLRSFPLREELRPSDPSSNASARGNLRSSMVGDCDLPETTQARRKTVHCRPRPCLRQRG